MNCHVLCVSPVESAYSQAYYKFTYFGHTLPTTFLDGDTISWADWQDGTTYPQSIVVGPNDVVYYHATGYSSSGICDAIERIYYDDFDPPYVTDLDPDDGETDVTLSTDIEGTIVDDGYGIDEASVSVEVTTSARDTLSGDLSFGGDMFELDYSFDPNDLLPHFVEVTVTVNADDLYDPPNEMDEYSYSFTTRSFNLQNPQNGEVIDVFGRGGAPVARIVIKDGETRGTPGEVEVEFVWEGVVRATEYGLLVDDNDDFSSPEVDVSSITDDSYTHTFTVDETTTYYWRVTADCPDNYFACRNDFSFTFNYNNTNVTPASLGHIKAGFAE